MRQLAVWLVALGSISILIMAWTVTQPLGGKFADYFEEKTNYTDNPDAQSAYEAANNTRIWGGRSILFIGVGLFLVWALGSMQRKEEYSGAYQR